MVQQVGDLPVQDALEAVFKDSSEADCSWTDEENSFREANCLIQSELDNILARARATMLLG